MTEPTPRSTTALAERPAGPEPRRTRRPRLLARAIAIVAAAFSLAGVAGAATAGPASAAESFSTASVCFQQDTGGAFTGPTVMQIYWNGYWYTVASQAGTNSGCTTWGLVNYSYTRFAVDYRLTNQASWSSQTQWAYIYPGTNTSFGTYIVTRRVR